MLHLIQSNKMEVLAEQLCTQLYSPQNLSHVFAEHPIWVQSPGMAQWLKLRIAERHGIAAHLNFPLPSSYIWQLYKCCLGETLPQESAFTKVNMAWKLMALLPEQMSRPEFEPVRQYLADNDSVKGYQLALKIADVFDQYLVYRPDWILSWEAGQDGIDGGNIEEHPWQPLLWRSLVAKTQELGESPWHRANLHQRLMTILTESPPDLPPQLMVFGISALPRQQLDVLQALAQHIEVTVFWLNPSSFYWGDVVDEKRRARTLVKASLAGEALADYLDVGNPLLASWGKLGQDFQDMVLETDPEQHDAFVSVPPQSLLTHLQHEIDELTLGGEINPQPDRLLEDANKIAVNRDDHSLQLVSCHSRLRELEVLHDAILRYLDQHPDAEPGDVIVMMPDVGQYAPLIHGVFGRQDDPLSLPYSISDRQLSEESPLVNSFMQVMNLQESRFGLSDVMDILTVPAVQRQFELSDAELEQCRHWLEAAGARWGLDSADRQRWSVPREQQNTWLFAIERLLAGYTTDTLLIETPDVIAPFPDIEGQSAQSLGRFVRFLRVLSGAQQACLKEETIEDKAQWAKAMLEQLYAPDEADSRVIQQLRSAIEAVAKHQSQYPHGIEQRIFLLALEQQLEDSGVGQRFLAGAINFCTLMPMRAVPFKYVCLLGMNDGDYPRSVTPMGFDLMQSARQRRGDRSRRLDDKYLFLEAILSAREALYISYIGRSQRDNAERLPSVLVSELLDYCEHVYRVADTDESLNQHLVHHAPLQPFSPRYFQPNQPHSYQKHWLQLAEQDPQGGQGRAFMTTPLPALPNMDAPDWRSWIQFFQNPCKGLFQSRWQVRFEALNEQVQDDEPFVIDGLTAYRIRQALIEEREPRQQVALRAEGSLPTGALGDVAIEPIVDEAATMAEHWQQVTQGRAPLYWDVQLNLLGTRLSERQGHIYGRHLLMWRAGSVRAVHELELWLRLLALSASGSSVTRAGFLGREGHWVAFSAPPQDEAQQLLEQFEQNRQRGLCQPLPFFIRLASMWLDKQDDNKVINAFDESSLYAEAIDPYIQRCFSGLDEVWQTFAECCEALWQPAINQRAEVSSEEWHAQT